MQVQYCYWPPNNVTKKIKRLEQPDKKNWTRHRVRVFAKTGISFYFKGSFKQNVSAITVKEC